ncbi:hypothetical protein LINPERHAP1_LOCUS36463, partial [Linum perenne]
LKPSSSHFSVLYSSPFISILQKIKHQIQKGTNPYLVYGPKQVTGVGASPRPPFHMSHSEKNHRQAIYHRHRSASAVSLLGRSRVRRLFFSSRHRGMKSSLPSLCRLLLVRWISLHAPIATVAGPGLVRPCFYLEDKINWMMTD